MVRLEDENYGWYSSMTIAKLLSEAGELDFCYVVKMNEEYYMRLDFEKTHVPDNSIVQLVPLIAGG